MKREEMLGKTGMLSQFWLKKLVLFSIKALHKTSQCIISLPSSLMHMLSCLLLYCRDKDFVQGNWDFILPTTAEQKLRKEKAGHHKASSHLSPINNDHNYSQYHLSTLVSDDKAIVYHSVDSWQPLWPQLIVCYPVIYSEFNIMQ